MSILIKNYIQCDNCFGSGIWRGEFHSSVCASCNGVGLLEKDKTQIPFERAVKLLCTRFTQLRSEFNHLSRLVPSDQSIEFEEHHNTPNSLYTHNKTTPLFWEPANYTRCHQCNGSGVYVGIVSSNMCGACRGTGITGADSNELPDHEQIAILGMRNKALKWRLAVLKSIPEVESKLQREHEDYIQTQMRD